MKRIKRLASLVLSMIMVLAMALPAFAAEGTTYKINIEGKTPKREYTAYQVFTGELSTNAAGEKVLSNIRWGKNIDLTASVDGKNLMGALVAAGIGITADMNAVDVAEVLQESTDANGKSEVAEKFADVISKYVTSAGAVSKPTAAGASSYTIEVAEVGYYLVKETGDLPADAAGNTTATFTDYILRVVGDTAVKTKDTTVTITKEIIDGADIVTANKAGIGDNVTYQLTSQVPDYTGFDYFYFIMNDTLSKGLDFNNDVVVTVGKTVLKRGTDYNVYVGANDALLRETDVATEKSFKIAFADIMVQQVGAVITVTYSAKINEDAVIGENGNPNEVTLRYSTDPNFSYDGTKDSGKPGLPDSTKNPPTGTTPKSIVVTFITQIDIFKFEMENGAQKAMDGAEFTLTGYSTETVLKDETVYTPDANGTHWQLLNGDYTTVPPTTTAEMRELPASAQAGYVEAEASYNGDDKVVVGGKTYRPYNASTDTGKTLYILVEPNSSDYASTVVKFKETKAQGPTKTTKYVTMRKESKDGGKIVFEGLGEGTFTITETKTPEGYNTADPITVEITGVINYKGNRIITGEETCTWTATNVTKDNGGTFIVEIENKKGSLLPSTGGIGTTIFYVVGGILVVGAGILLVTKKRMSER